ncbi:TniQ family protein [Hydrogenophaga laconesensis]|uniref:TniQ domain-containing protein n=1 Tax=Hydrogenophaga laconesensis TaxID=1805971 RepID=A0ABU1V936_9BURK|nr:TniQ family protein [Hydrogenophaga laconesensis]MDR7093952.1 hypothetical protein [Hydrogenophaga laconesensis]
MRYLLQRPLPDEILTSALVRTCVQFDVAIKPLLNAIGVNPGSPGFFHMSKIAAYAQVFRMDPTDLLNQATVFPSLVAFQPGDRRMAFEMAATQGIAIPGVQLSALQSTTAFVPYRRLCSKCVRTDKARYGWAYWHVSHHLPGVTLCARHGTRLRETTLTTSSGRGRWSYQLPEVVDSTLPAARPGRFDLELNRLALGIQAGEVQLASDALPLRFYRCALERAGLVAEDRQVNASAARAWVAGHLQGLAGSSGLLRCDPSLAWVDLILRDRPGVPFAACKHLIIQAALASTERPAAATLNHKSTGFRGRPLGDLDVVKAAELDARIRMRLKSPARFTLQEEMEALGVWSAFRHSRHKYPALSKVVARHRAAMQRRKTRVIGVSGTGRRTDSSGATDEQHVT